MKNGLVFFAVVIAAGSLWADESAWLDNYGEALKGARGSSRPLLIVLDRADTQLHPVSFVPDDKDQSSQEELLARYVLCRIDVDTAYGKRVADAFKVSEFPHSAIIDKTATRILYQKTGQFSDSVWTAALTAYQDGEQVQAYQPTVYYQPTQTYRNSSRYCRT